MKNIILGIHGKKQSGKDTVASYLVEKHKFTRIGFADALYELCNVLTLYILSVRQKGSPSSTMPISNCQRNMDLWFQRYGISIDSVPHLRIMDEVIHNPVKDFLSVEEQTGKHRALLQYIGTDIFRSHNKNFWIDCLRSQIRAHIAKNPRSNFVIPDVRFLNEHLEITRMVDGVCVQIVRDTGLPRDNHLSETELDEVKFKYVINNNLSYQNLYEQVEELLEVLNLYEGMEE